MNERHPTERFSDRVDNYVRYRPDYPPALLDWLQRELAVDTGWRVADIGAGTGISSRLLLEGGYQVITVEPNAPMRAAAERDLAAYAGFRAVDGRADATGLAAASIDLITVAQAFHWFDEQTTRGEFARILRPDGLAAIWWNSRRLVGTPFLEGYEALLRAWGTDYESVAERYPDDSQMRAWFADGYRAGARFAHCQQLDFEGLRGRLMSSSYVPPAGHPNHQPMLQALRELFDACAVQGRISFDYDTRIFAGHLV